MIVYVLVITLFYFGSTEKHPEAGARTYPSIAACVDAGRTEKARLEASSEVALATWGCLAVSDEGKTKS